MSEQQEHRSPDKKRRSAASLNAILAATYEVLQEDGFRTLTIEGVAARAGVGKSTIYRWWPSKGALAVEAFLLHVTPQIEYTDTGSARRDIGSQMRRLAQAFEGTTGRIVREMWAMAQLDDETLKVFKEGFLEPRRVAARQMLFQGVEQGEFHSDFDPDTIIDALYGPMHHRLLLRRTVADEEFLRTVESAVLNSISLR